jgi:hypothetical protein
MLADARTEADKIVGDARSEADSFAQDRNQKKAEVDAEMAEMTGLVAGVRNQLAVLATTVADKLDEMDAVVSGAHSQGGIEPETDTGTADSEDDLADDGPEDVAIDDADDENQDVEDGDDSGPDGEAGLEVDLEEDLESGNEGDKAGSSEIEGGDSEENQEI